MEKFRSYFGKNIWYLSVVILGMYGIESLTHFVNPHYPFSLEEIDWQATGQFFYIILTLSFCGPKTRASLLGIMLLMTVIQLLNFQYFGTFLQPISFYQAYAFPEEAAESFWDELDSMLLPSFIVGVMGTIMFYLTQRVGSSMITYRYMPIVLILLFVGDLALTYILLNNKHGKLWNAEAMLVMPKPHILAQQNMFRSIKYFTLGIVPKKLFGNINMYPEIPSPHISVKNPDVNIILIIGESLRADHLSLLGYTKHVTTPRLDQLKTLKAKTIYTSGTMSLTGVGGILNRLKHPGVTTQITNQSNCLFRLAKQNAFSTYFVTAYQRQHMKIMENVLCKKNIDHYITRSEFDETMSAHDMALAEYLDHIDFRDSNFIVLNQRGSHSPYGKRFPPEFKKFDSDYDNSILYTDYVITEIITTLREKSQKPTYIFFTADHGELLNEEGLNGHGWFKQQVYEVPLLALTHHIDDADALENISYIQSHYDLSTFVIQLLGYDQYVERSAMKDIFINGSDIDGLAGYLRLTVKHGVIQKEEVIR